MYFSSFEKKVNIFFSPPPQPTYLFWTLPKGHTKENKEVVKNARGVLTDPGTGVVSPLRVLNHENLS